jgi:hypothetical protein
MRYKTSLQVIFSHANLENKNQLVLELLEEVTKNGNKLSILTDELKRLPLLIRDMMVLIRVNYRRYNL